MKYLTLLVKEKSGSVKLQQQFVETFSLLKGEGGGGGEEGGCEEIHNGITCMYQLPIQAKKAAGV